MKLYVEYKHGIGDKTWISDDLSPEIIWK